MSRSIPVAGALLAVSLLVVPAARAVSIPVETDWAAGTSWEHHDSFLGFPDTWVYVPDSFSPGVPDRRGAVFHLMGCGQTTFQVAQGAGWPEAAEEYGLVVVVPGIIAPAHPNGDAPNVECFNYGYDGAYGVYEPTRNDPDHAALIAAGRSLTADPDLAHLRVDPHQVYLAGMSAGGAVAVEVGCMAPDVFSGVATAASPGIGSAQGTAIMPPRFGFSADSVAALCRQYARSSGLPDALDLLSLQTHAIVSDDNSLPAGGGPLDTSKFYDQRIWDGDKFCPHVYQEVRAEAFSDLLGLGAPALTSVAVAEGTGMGCPGGERSHDDRDEVECQVNESVDREWTALADLWRDAEGRTRLVKIEQDTLRHTWPSGSPGPGDETVTPTRDDLRRDGYIDEDTGGFTRDLLNQAPNGMLGVIYLNERAMDFPLFVAELWADNSPRLAPPPVDDPPEDDPPVDDPPVDDPPEGTPPTVSLLAAEAGTVGCLTARGEAEAPDGTVAGVTVTLLGLGPLPARLSEGAWTFERCALDPGHWTVFATAVDDQGRTSAPSQVAGVTLGGEGEGVAERVEGTLTEHCNAGRVTRFTPDYFRLRDEHCRLELFVWTCDPFPLFRCEGDEEWTDQEPDCDGGAAEPGEASLALSLVAWPPSARVGEAAVVLATVDNDGPDPASAVYLRDELPASLAWRGGDPRCHPWLGSVLCHLGPLGPAESVEVELVTTAVAAGTARHEVSAGSTQSAGLTTAAVVVEVEPGDPGAAEGPGRPGRPPGGGEGEGEGAGEDPVEGSPAPPGEGEGERPGGGDAPGGQTPPPDSDPADTPTGLPQRDTPGEPPGPQGGRTAGTPSPSGSGCQVAGRATGWPTLLVLALLVGRSRRRCRLADGDSD